MDFGLSYLEDMDFGLSYLKDKIWGTSTPEVQGNLEQSKKTVAPHTPIPNGIYDTKKEDTIDSEIQVQTIATTIPKGIVDLQPRDTIADIDNEDFSLFTYMPTNLNAPLEVMLASLNLKGDDLISKRLGTTQAQADEEEERVKKATYDEAEKRAEVTTRIEKLKQLSQLEEIASVAITAINLTAAGVVVATGVATGTYWLLIAAGALSFGNQVAKRMGTWEWIASCTTDNKEKQKNRANYIELGVGAVTLALSLGGLIPSISSINLGTLNYNNFTSLGQYVSNTFSAAATSFTAGVTSLTQNFSWSAFNLISFNGGFWKDNALRIAEIGSTTFSTILGSIRYYSDSQLSKAKILEVFATKNSSDHFFNISIIGKLLETLSQITETLFKSISDLIQKKITSLRIAGSPA